MINIHDILNDDENGIINRLKLQKYVYLAQTSLENNFGYDYSIYNNGPYSPELANYYYDNIRPAMISNYTRNCNWSENKTFAEKFLDLLKDKEPEWLEVATTLIDSSKYCESEQETLDKVYAIKSKYSKVYIDEVWAELKNKELINKETGLKLNNIFTMF
jgi:uncharacterized protein YwgA